MNGMKNAAMMALVCGAAIGASMLGGCAGKPTGPGDVAGRFIVAVCDADMAATAFRSFNCRRERPPGARMR